MQGYASRARAAVSWSQKEYSPVWGYFRGLQSNAIRLDGVSEEKSMGEKLFFYWLIAPQDGHIPLLFSSVPHRPHR